MKRAIWLGILLLATSCASSGGGQPSLPYKAWTLGFFAPSSMAVWIETADVEDVRGRVFSRAGSGTAAIGYRENPSGWPRKIGLSGRQVTGADLPKRIYVRWQSLVEPQTYRVTLEIPEHARKLMLQSERAKHIATDELFFRKFLVLGLAPGGYVKAWVLGVAGEPIEVLCTRAEIEPNGPSQGRYVTLNERTKAYVDEHPIPYGSWDCGKPNFSQGEH